SPSKGTIMTVTSSIKSPEALTLAITAEFPAAVERVWQIWEDPRQLERWWGFTAIDGPTRLELNDGFADDAGNRIADMGQALMAVSIADAGGRTAMTITTTFESAEQMQKMLEMGMEEG